VVSLSFLDVYDSDKVGGYAIKIFLVWFLLLVQPVTACGAIVIVTAKDSAISCITGRQ
jgi:hypothetical protein